MSKRRPKKAVKTTDMAQKLRRGTGKTHERPSCLASLWSWRKIIALFSAGSLLQMELEAPPQELAATTRQAIADATDFDERDINRNFSYDYEFTARSNAT